MQPSSSLHLHTRGNASMLKISQTIFALKRENELQVLGKPSRLVQISQDVEDKMLGIRQAIRHTFVAGALLLASAIIATGLFEWYLRVDAKRMGQIVTFAEADFYPYLGVANLFPLDPAGVLQREYGYHKGDVLYQHRKTEQIRFSGDRFEQLFQLAHGQTADPNAFRIFVVGSSVVQAGNVPLPERYFSKLQQALTAPYPVQVVAVGKGGAASTEELVLFTLSVLPNRPDMVVLLNGADYALGSMIGVRPGDPFNASMMYSKHYEIFFNLMRWGADRSKVVQLFYQRAIYRDLDANVKFVRENDEYRAARLSSMVSVYLSNARTVSDICEGLGIPFVLAPQPMADVLLKRHGEAIRKDPARLDRITERVESLPISSYRLPSFVVDAHEAMLAGIAKSPRLAPNFVDIQEAVEVDHFVDFVHQDATGQAQLAASLAAAIQKRLPAEWSPQHRDRRNPAWP